MYLIYGKNKVGTAVAGLCDHLGIEYHICDDSDAPSDLSGYEVIIPSPGIPSSHRIYATNRVVSELDFADRFLPKQFKKISITGTDGKSTTTWILYSILQKEYFGKKKVYLSGNFDIPYSETVRDILVTGEKKGIIVLEVSSFMAYAVRTFETDYSIFTNLKPDHLNWHKDLQEYLDAKMNLMQHTSETSVINEQILAFAEENSLELSVPKNVRIFGIEKSTGLYLKKGNKQDLRDRTDGHGITVSGRYKFDISDTNFSGSHNAMNILACMVVTNSLGICSKRVKEYLKSITGLPHRIELVCEISGVRYIDDSKSTSCQSLIAALSAFPKENIILIAGGSDKGDTFDGLDSALQGIKYGVFIGATRDIFAKKAQIAGVSSVFVEDMDFAVREARLHATPGDVILLSPGCASFGLFRDYLDRANKFREAIVKLQ